MTTSAKPFEALAFPPWIRWGQRKGAHIDNAALRAVYADAKHYERTADGTLRLTGSVRRCGWCAAECPRRRTAWCSDTCAARFYRVWSWGAVVQYVSARDGGICRRCGNDDGGPAHGNHYTGWQVDHIVPVLDGGTDDPENLRLLCHDCHVAVGYEQRAARKQQPSLFSTGGAA